MSRLLILALLIAALATPARAFDRGDVLLENRMRTKYVSYELWQHFGWRYAIGTGFQLIYKFIPFVGPGHFLAPASNQIVFHSDRTVSVWDGVPVWFTDPGKGYTEIFTADADLGEIAPMRSGNFLVAGETLIEFNLHGRVAEYPIAAKDIELLADQCTVLYDDAAGNRVHRFDICRRQPLTDFASLIAGEAAGSIRQLQSGDVVVANGSAILQFTWEGSLVRSYPFPGVTHLALSLDGRTFYAAGVHDDKAELRHYDPNGESESIQLGNDGMTSIIFPDAVSDLVTVGEWRAALTAVRSRAVRRR